MRRVLLSLAGGLALVVAPVIGAGQDDVPVFRAGVDLVDVDVSVLDSNRLPVRGLTAADFTIVEDGESRPIVAFSAVDLPPRRIPDAPWMADVAPDVVDNDLQHVGRLPASPGALPGVVVYTGAFNREGRELASTEQSVTVDPRSATDDVFEYEVVSRLDLPPGRYELRTAVEDTHTGRTGSVYTYVDVPDFRQTDVAMSGLLVGVSPGGPVAPVDPLAGLAPIVPTARRTFLASESVEVFVRLYQGLTRSATGGYVTTEILDATNAAVYRQETRLETASFGASRAVDFRMDLPVGRLGPGAYVLGIEARHGNATARRDLRFSIR